MAFQFPQFRTMPASNITNEGDPARDEIIAYHTAVDNWRAVVLGQMMFMVPTHGFNEPFPTIPAINADTDVCAARLQTIRLYTQNLFNVYAPAYGSAALAFGQAPPPPLLPAAAAAARTPKTPLPERFEGKSSAAGRRFLAECDNYASLNSFPDEEHQIRWALQLLDGQAVMWKEEQFRAYNQAPAPIHLTDWGMFKEFFNKRWADPGEAQKALSKLQKGFITQKTSVKVYNDQFNEQLSLTGLTGTNPAILQAYTDGLKSQIRATAIVALRATPNITFDERQVMLAEIDDELLQARAIERPAGGSSQNPRSRPQYVINFQNPMPGTSMTPATQGGRASSTPAPQAQTPIKVEAARQYTRITPEEREHLRSIGGCFRCRQTGHMAHQCPRNVQVATIVPETPTATIVDVTPNDVPASPAPTDSASSFQ